MALTDFNLEWAAGRVTSGGVTQIVRGVTKVRHLHCAYHRDVIKLVTSDYNTIENCLNMVVNLDNETRYQTLTSIISSFSGYARSPSAAA